MVTGHLLLESLAAREASGLTRKRGSGNITGELVDFSSNDYLGLRSHPRVVSALRQSAVAGSGASPVLTGHTTYHARLEIRVGRAQWLARCSRVQ